MLPRLLHIGSGEDVAISAESQAKYGVWADLIGPDEQLWFAYAEVPEWSRERARAALVLEHRPVLRQKGDSFCGPARTHIRTYGANAGLKNRFTTGRYAGSETLMLGHDEALREQKSILGQDVFSLPRLERSNGR